jgi:hypothetical protein
VPRLTSRLEQDSSTPSSTGRFLQRAACSKSGGNRNGHCIGVHSTDAEAGQKPECEHHSHMIIHGLSVPAAARLSGLVSVPPSHPPSRPLPEVGRHCAWSPSREWSHYILRLWWKHCQARLLTFQLPGLALVDGRAVRSSSQATNAD